MPTYIMRAYDPNGGAYEVWSTQFYDATGIGYAGVPPFNTLVNVHAQYVFGDSGGSGSATPATRRDASAAFDAFVAATNAGPGANTNLRFVEAPAPIGVIATVS